MKQTILLILIFTLAGAAYAQQKSTETKAPPPSSAPARIEIAPDVQQTLATGQANVRAAQSALDAAQLRFENLILKLRLLLKVPDDYELRIDEKGVLYFERQAAQDGNEKPTQQK